MVHLKMDKKVTPYLGVLQPLTVNLAVVTIIPMGLNIELEKCFSAGIVQGSTVCHPTSHTFLSSDQIDPISQRFSVKLIQSRHFASPVGQSQPGSITEEDLTNEGSKPALCIFDPAVLNQWSVPNSENPEIAKMSTLFCKEQDQQKPSHSKETDLLKRLKQFYRKADSPSRLMDKKETNEDRPVKTGFAEPVAVCTFQNADDPKPRLLKKLRSFTLGPTRAEMILTKSMKVVEQQNKVGKEDTATFSQVSEVSKESEEQMALIVKSLENETCLVAFIKHFYELTLQQNLDPWDRMHRIANVVLGYMKENAKENPESAAKQILEDELYIYCSNLRNKYMNKSSELDKQEKIQEYQLQIILRMEIQSSLRLVSAKDDNALDNEDEDPSLEAMVEDIVMMLRMLSFITDASLVPMLLNDVLLKNYGEVLPQALANIYDELMQPLPSVLAAVVMSPESNAPSMFCPSSVSSFTLEEAMSFQDMTTITTASQNKKTKPKQVLPGLGERPKRQIVVGKKPTAAAATKKDNAVKKKSSKKSTEETIKARRSLFTSDKKKLGETPFICCDREGKV